MSDKDKDIQKILNKIYNKYKNIHSGKNASYIPELAKVNPKIFGISFVTCDGKVYEIGDSRKEISIQSISKVFSLSMAVDEFGENEVDKKIGVMGSSLPFNSIMAAALTSTNTINPFVNQGAIATTSLFYNKNKTVFRNKILNNIDKYAGRKLTVNKKVFNSEMKTNANNMALAYLLKSKDRFYGDVDSTVSVYTEQCSKNINAKDIAVMAAVFAAGGVHPLNGKKIISKKAANYTYRSLRGQGLYEYSAKWDNDVGCVSAKSGVGGGLFIIIKGVGGIGIVSPPLDKFGNSVRGIKAGTMLTNEILKLFNAGKYFCSKEK